MPLLVSPIDGSPMKQIVRNGIEIDMCPTSGGVWLDKGELEKLLAAVQEAIDESDDDFQNFKKAKHEKRLPPEYYQHQGHPPHGYHPHKRYDDDDYEDYHKYKYGKKSKLKTFMDIFD